MKNFMNKIGKGQTMGLVGLAGTIAGITGMLKTKKDISNSETEEELEKNLKKFRNYGKLTGVGTVVSGTGMIIAGAEQVEKSERLFSDEEISKLKGILNTGNDIIAEATDIQEEIIQEAEEVAETIIEESNKTIEE